MKRKPKQTANRFAMDARSPFRAELCASGPFSTPAGFRDWYLSLPGQFDLRFRGQFNYYYGTRGHKVTRWLDDPASVVFPDDTYRTAAYLVFFNRTGDVFSLDAHFDPHTGPTPHLLFSLRFRDEATTFHGALDLLKRLFETLDPIWADLSDDKRKPKTNAGIRGLLLAERIPQLGLVDYFNSRFVALFGGPGHVSATPGFTPESERGGIWLTRNPTADLDAYDRIGIDAQNHLCPEDVWTISPPSGVNILSWGPPNDAPRWRIWDYLIGKTDRIERRETLFQSLL